MSDLHVPSPGAAVSAPRRILVVGSGGREHALAWRLASEQGVELVLAAPGSDAIAAESGILRCAPGVSATDGAALAALAQAERIELVVVGPEAPLAAGVADVLTAAGIPTFGPQQAAARIESSKAFCRDVAAAAGVRMARGQAFTALAPALAFARELAIDGGVVVKADGLAAGKGVIVCDTLAEADEAIRALFPDGDPQGDGDGRPRLVVEERLEGPEASLIAICDGRDAYALPAARDHKRLMDADEGPNTGGMGAYSPLPDVPDDLAARLVDQVHRPVLAEMARRGHPFTGALYAGLMLTKTGPALLEFNARFGDPEAQVLLPRVDVPLGQLLLAAARGELGSTAAALGLAGSPVLPATPDAAVAIVLAAAGYPGTPRSGDAITGLADAARQGALVFHAGTVRDAEGTWRTKGGRVLAVVGRGSDLTQARARAEAAAQLVTFDGAQRRHDIAAVVPPAATLAIATAATEGAAR